MCGLWSKMYRLQEKCICAVSHTEHAQHNWNIDIEDKLIHEGDILWQLRVSVTSFRPSQAAEIMQSVTLPLSAQAVITENSELVTFTRKSHSCVLPGNSKIQNQVIGGRNWSERDAILPVTSQHHQRHFEAVIWTPLRQCPCRCHMLNRKKRCNNENDLLDSATSILSFFWETGRESNSVVGL